METLSLPLLLSLATALISGAFALLVLRRWWTRRKPHHLAWGIGLVMFFLGALSQVVLTQVWSPLFFGLWYWSGALMVAPWLGQGSVYLLVRRGNIARYLQMLLLLISIMTLPWALFLTPFNPEAWRPNMDMASLINDIMQRGGVRAFSPVMNVWGTVALAGGAIYSARLFRRKQIMQNRMVGNWLIAAGGLLPALGGVLIRLELPELKYIAELLGVILIFIGYRIATNIPEEVEARKHGAAARPVKG